MSRIDIGNVDWKLLRGQKKLLVELTSGRVITLEHELAVDGIINLLDHIQDEAVLRGIASESEVFLTEAD